MLEAFKVGILIALNNKASYGLGIIARDFVKTEAQAAKLRNTIKQVSLLTIGGAALVTAGMFGLKAADSWMEAGSRYVQAYSRFQQLNLGERVNRDADHFAQAARLNGVTATELMQTVTDLHTVFGNYDHAKAMAPMIARMEFANKAVFGDATKFNAQQALTMGKVIEMRGGFKSEDEMKRQADFMQHVMSGTGGRVMPSDYLAFLKTAGVAGRLQDNQAFYYQMEPLIQEMGGNRVGTALMSAYQNLGQGRTTARTAKELARLGLVQPGMAEYDKVGQLVRLKPGAVKGGDMVASNPLQFLREVLLPAFAKKGITGEKQVLNEIATIFTNRTAASLFSLIYLQAGKIDKNMGVNRNAMGVAGLMKAGDNTPEGIKIRAAASIENFKTQLGLHVLPVVLPMLVAVANGVQALASAAQRHPTLTKWLVLTAIGLSAVAVVVGSIALVAGAVMLIAAAIGGGISAGVILAITGIVAAVVALGAALIAFWPKIVGGFHAIVDAVGNFFGWLWSKVPDWAKRMFGLGTASSTGQKAPQGSSFTPWDKRPLGQPAAPGPWGNRPMATLAGGGSAANATELAGAMASAMNGVKVQLDGKTVGRLVTQHQDAQAGKPNTGATGFDPRMAPIRPDMLLAPG